MAEIKVADVVAKVLKEEGVEWYAGVHGGHVWQLMVAIDRAGIKCYHMRHEQSGSIWQMAGPELPAGRGLLWVQPGLALAI